MRFAILGLSLSHPYAFAEYLTAQGHQIASVWDYEPARAATFAATYGAAVATSPEAAVAVEVDGVIVTSMTRDHFAHARVALAAGVPVYIDKLLTLDPLEAEALCAMGTPLMSGSALRFLPSFEALVDQVRSGACGVPLSARAEVYHGMKAYLQPGSTWQDDPALSGGVLMNMGIHAVDLLIAALGPAWTVAGAQTARRVHQKALSEDQAALLLRGASGELATIQVVCGTERHHYACTVTGSEADLHWQFPDPRTPVPNVYGPMLERFIGAIRTGDWPVPPSEMIAAVRLLASAREMAG
jgi:predicted dehydrogenase